MDIHVDDEVVKNERKEANINQLYHFSTQESSGPNTPGTQVSLGDFSK